MNFLPELHDAISAKNIAMSGTELTVSWSIPSLLIEMVGVESLESVELSFPMSATISITAESLSTNHDISNRIFYCCLINWLTPLIDHYNDNDSPVYG